MFGKHRKVVVKMMRKSILLLKTLATIFVAVALSIVGNCHAETTFEEFFFIFPLDIEVDCFNEYISERYGVSLEYRGGSFNTNSFVPWNGRQLSMTYSFPGGAFSSAGVSVQLSSERQDGSTNLNDAYIVFLELCDMLEESFGTPTNGWILVDRSHKMFSYDLPLHDGRPDDAQTLNLLMRSPDRTVSVWKEYHNISIIITRAGTASEYQYDGWINLHYLNPNMEFPLPSGEPFHGEEGPYKF